MQMVKHLLTLAAAASMAFAANAVEINLPLTDLGSGWSSSYDASTQTITYDSEWAGRGWWLGSVNYSDYEEVRVEIENPGWYMQLIVQYNNEKSEAYEEHFSQTQPFGEDGVAVLVLNEDLKNDVMQIYIQSGSAGEVKVLSGIVRNSEPAVEWDSKVIFEGNKEMDWYPGLEIDKNLIIEAGAGSQLVTEVEFSGDGYSFKYGINWTQDVLPSFTQTAGYQPEWLTIWTNQPTLTFTFTTEDIEALEADEDGVLHLCGQGGSITKVTLQKESSSAVRTVAPAACEDVYYNLQGIRVTNPTKGLYIHNGKKVIL